MSHDQYQDYSNGSAYGKNSVSNEKEWMEGSWYRLLLLGEQELLGDVVFQCEKPSKRRRCGSFRWLVDGQILWVDFGTEKQEIQEGSEESDPYFYDLFQQPICSIGGRRCVDPGSSIARVAGGEGSGVIWSTSMHKWIHGVVPDKSDVKILAQIDM